ncbi:choice-of-anchor tandem repeat GloVer-containing protein [Verrucomicrobiota bacterium sgz303538]
MRRTVLHLIALFVTLIGLGRARANISFATLDSWELDGWEPRGVPVRSVDGNFYGVTARGGARDAGVIYRVTPEGAYTIVCHLAKAARDLTVSGLAGPIAGLIAGPDGSLYGTIGWKDERDAGAIFRFTPDGALTVLHRFTGPQDSLAGGYPAGRLCAGPDGALYGVTLRGGIHNGGIIFRLASDGAFSVLHHFESNGIGIPPGPNALTTGRDGALYGTTYEGGNSDEGTFFRLTTDGEFSTLYSFPASGVVHPSGELVEGEDGVFYGVGNPASMDNTSCVFKVAVRTGEFTVLHSFGTVAGDDSGAGLQAGLTFADGYLYGVTASGGEGGSGTLFRLDSEGNLTVLYSFTSAEGGWPIAPPALFPDGSLLCTSLMAPTRLGVGGSLYRVSTEGVASPAHVFGESSESDVDGLVEGDNGTLYGIARSGGAHGFGTFFKIVPGQSHVVLHHFHPAEGGVLQGGLVRGEDGNFYGLRDAAYDPGDGKTYLTKPSAFRITANGEYTRLHTFSDAEGSNPVAPLTRGHDGALYGTMNRGGSADLGYSPETGTAFKLTQAGAFTLLHDFNGTDGAWPLGALYHAADGNLYGVTARGGAANKGVIFRLAPSGEYSVLHAFSGADGEYPYTALTEDSDGSLFGAAFYGGYFGSGVTYRLTATGDFSIVRSCQRWGELPAEALLAGGDGFFYGTSSYDSTGTVYRISRTGAFTVLHDFFASRGDLREGSFPFAAMLRASNGDLYGTTSQGGVGGGGTVFRLRFEPPVAVDDLLFVVPGKPATIDAFGNDAYVQGNGFKVEITVQPRLGKAIVQVGARGVFTYMPGPGFRESDSFTYTITDSSGRTSTATVMVRNPFAAGRGRFAPVLLRGGVPAGVLRVKVTETGVFTGSLRVDGALSAFRGIFNFQGNFQTALRISRSGFALLSLHLDPVTGLLTGTLNMPGSDEIVLLAEAKLAGKPLPEAPTGRYTLLLRPPDSPFGAPQGCGWATFTVDKRGGSRLSGRFGNGLSWSASTALRADGALPLFVEAGRFGSLHGTLRFRTTERSDCDGVLSWLFPQPSGVSSRMELIGPQPLSVEGSRYVAPARGRHGLDFTDLSQPIADLRGAAFSGQTVIFNSRGAVPMLGSVDKFAFSLNRQTGVFTGRAPTGLGPADSVHLSGVLFQRSNKGYGVSYTQTRVRAGVPEAIDFESGAAVELDPR